MSYEIGQLDVSDRELLPARARPRASMPMEIGEAVVTHTIFGRAKVRIIRKHYSVRRTFWLTVMAVLAAAAAAAWLEWIASQQAGTLQGAGSEPPVRASVQDAPLVRPENIPVPAATLPTTNEPAPAQAGIGNPAIARQVAPQAAQGPDAAAPIPAKPARRPKPSTASPPPDANDTASMEVTVPPVAQPVEDRTEAAVAPAPAVKGASNRSSPEAGQAPDPAGAQP